MESHEVVTKFFQNTTLEERRHLNHYGIFRHNISEVVEILKSSPLQLNFPREITKILQLNMLD